MNINKLKNLVDESGLTKQMIAEKCSISRPTLDNVLGGADAKISTIESLASFFNVPVGYFFDSNNVNQSCAGNSNVLVGRDNNGSISMAEIQSQLDDALREIKHLKERLKDKEEMIEILKRSNN